MISSRFAQVVGSLLAIGSLALAQAAPAADATGDQKPLPIALVDALNKLSDGQHKGLMVVGTFTSGPVAASFSKAPGVSFSRRSIQ